MLIFKKICYYTKRLEIKKYTIENKIIYKIFILLVKSTNITTQQAIIVACLALRYKDWYQK